MKLGLCIFILASAMLALQLSAAEAARDGVEPQKVQELVENLGSDEFETRNKAEQALTALGAQILPALKESLKQSKDMEISTRLRRVLKALALETETDAGILAGYAREEALAERFENAAKYYARAAKFFNEQAQKLDGDAKKDALAKAARASSREKRALSVGRSRAQAGEVKVVGGVRVDVFVVSDSDEDGVTDDW